MNGDMYKPVCIQEGYAFYECQRCFALVRDSGAHDHWHQASTGYSAEERERWRTEILGAKATMTKEEFRAWLDRRMNSAAG